MRKEKIASTLFKLGIISLTIIFVVVVVVVLAMRLSFTVSHYKSVSQHLHFLAEDIHSSILLIEKFNEKEKYRQQQIINDINVAKRKFDKDLKTIKSDYLKIYSLESFESLERKMNLYRNSLFEVESFKIDQQIKNLNDVYIQVLQLEKKHNDNFTKNFEYEISICVLILMVVLFGVAIVFYYRLKDIFFPLNDLTKISMKLAYSKENVAFNVNYKFYEYSVLAKSLCDMQKRMSYESRVDIRDASSLLVSHFAENLAHSINNPLAIIATSVKLLQRKDKIKDDPELLNETQGILKQISRITETTHKMKRIIFTQSKSSAVKFDFNNITTFINLLFFNRFFEKNVKFTTIDLYKKDILGVEEVITRIIFELIENALLYNDSKNPEIEITIQELNNRVVIKVADNGSSPDMNLINSYLEGVNLTKNLGLSTAKQMAEELAYELHYSIKPKKEFILTL